MQSLHNRKIVFSGIALTLGKMIHYRKKIEIFRDEIEDLLLQSDYLLNAPFLWIGMVFRFGLKNETVPHYNRINRKYGDLPLALQLDTRVLIVADRHDPEVLKEFLEIAALDALIHAGQKYKLPIEALQNRRTKLGRIPDWEYDMEEDPELMFQRYRESKAALLT